MESKTIIYCKKYDCPYNKPISEMIFSHRKQHYIPFIKDTCKGVCTNLYTTFLDIDFSNSEMVKRAAVCKETYVEL